MGKWGIRSEVGDKKMDVLWAEILPFAFPIVLSEDEFVDV